MGFRLRNKRDFFYPRFCSVSVMVSTRHSSSNLKDPPSKELFSVPIPGYSCCVGEDRQCASPYTTFRMNEPGCRGILSPETSLLVSLVRGRDRQKSRTVPSSFPLPGNQSWLQTDSAGPPPIILKRPRQGFLELCCRGTRDLSGILFFFDHLSL